MKKFGLIGHPIAHSLSPALFKAGYDGRYPYDLIESDDFETAYDRFLKEYDGINVTAPFKELALQKADIISEECKAVGATNLLIKTPDGITAYNSDCRGLILWLSSVVLGYKRTPVAPYQGQSSLQKPTGLFADRSLVPAARGVARFCTPTPQMITEVLIVGYGGAGKAADAAARSLGMNVTILNRTCKEDGIKPLEEFRSEFRKADIVIYNLPMRIAELDMLTEEDCTPGQQKVILEANYRNPAFDRELLEKIQNWNPLVKYEEGQTWLLMQAITGYELFTGEAPDAEKMLSVIKSK